MHRSNIKRISNTGHQCPRTMVRWTGGGCAGQHRVMQNETPQTSTAATFGRSSIARPAAGASRGRGRGHRRRRHHRRNRGSHPGRGRRVLALGRRPLYQDHPRPDPPDNRRPTAPTRCGCGRSASVAEGRAGLILIETLRTMTLGTMAELSQVREEPATPEELSRLSLDSQAHRRHRQAPPRAGADGGQGSQGRGRRGAGTGPGTAQEGPLAGDRRPHRRGRGGVSLSASAPGHIGAGRPVESFGIPRIPLNPT